MEPKKLAMAHGNWVNGDRFWGREPDLEIFISRIEEGAHQFLNAQRRMGKTSLMKETAKRLGDSYTSVFIDLQKCSAAPDAIVELSLALHPFKPLWTKLASAFGGIFTRVRDTIDSVELGEIGLKFRADLVGDWRRKGDQLMSVLSDSETPVLLLIDEASILLNRILKGDDYRITPERRSEADLFLSWLRDNSIRHQGKIRIVLSGSIGLEPILRQGRLSAALNNFEPFELKPWDERTACGCIEALAAYYSLRYEQGVPQKMVDMLGCCIPHHMQMFFRHTYDWWIKQHHRDISLRDIDVIYKQEMLSIHGHAELTHYEERLRMVLGDEIFQMALELLTETAVVGSLSPEATDVVSKSYEFDSMSVSDAQKEIFILLEHDGYIERKDGVYRFVSQLLRDWWKARNEYGYIPALKRED